jgi:hypothetical protein
MALIQVTLINPKHSLNFGVGRDKSQTFRLLSAFVLLNAEVIIAVGFLSVIFSIARTPGPANSFYKRAGVRDGVTTI